MVLGDEDLSVPERLGCQKLNVMRSMLPVSCRYVHWMGTTALTRSTPGTSSSSSNNRNRFICPPIEACCCQPMTETNRRSCALVRVRLMTTVQVVLRSMLLRWMPYQQHRKLAAGNWRSRSSFQSIRISMAPPKIYRVRQKKVSHVRFLQFSQQSLEISKWNFTDIFSHPVSIEQSYRHTIGFQHFKVISVTVMPPGDIGVLENVQAITQQIMPFKLK